MTMHLQIVRRTLIIVFLLTALIGELTILATAAAAQNYSIDPVSAPSPISAGSAINSGASGTSTPPIGSGNLGTVPANPSLLAVPIMGTAPLTVDFYVGLANTPGSLFYEWNFGDGAESYLPALPYLLHVYQNPGTYLCQLELFTPQGISTTAFVSITVKQRED
jgi:PKD repeat protein